MTKGKKTTTGKAEADYRHPTSDLSLQPELETQAQFKKKKAPKTYRYDPSLHPAFEWDGQNPGRESSARLLPPGTVLPPSRATIGFTAINTVPMATNQGFANLICADRLLPDYLARWLPSQKERLLQLAGSTTFKKIELPLPPLNEQRRIVDFLGHASSIWRLREQAQAKARDHSRPLPRHVRRPRHQSKGLGKSVFRRLGGAVPSRDKSEVPRRSG